MILVTGAAGFIGSHVCQALLERGELVLGLDSLSSYYDPSLKRARLARLEAHPTFQFVQQDIADREGMETLFASHPIDQVIHLAAQVGVRHSIHHPHDYLQANLAGTLNVLEGCRALGVRHLVYASSSSVYGLNEGPFTTRAATDHPASLYAATKKSNELLVHSYSHLYGIPSTGLRFFTVYGSWGRPDMAAWIFAESILDGKPIRLFNHGAMERDFTHVSDIVSGLVKALDLPPKPDPHWNDDEGHPASSSAPWRILNLGSHRPIRLRAFVESLERALDKQAIIEMAPFQDGDVVRTCADIERTRTLLGWEPRVPLDEGLAEFTEWLRRWRATSGARTGVVG